ncbi:MAG: sulfotransferase [Saprospiraceae bacterium]
MSAKKTVVPTPSTGKPLKAANSPSAEHLHKEGSKSLFRRLLHKFIPANFDNIFGLTKRLLVEGEPAGRVAMVYSLAGLLLTPLDMFLQLFEKRLYKSATAPQLPQLFVCGAPRSGTTLTAQVLIKHLPVYYFNNLTSLFPRSPIMALKLFGWMMRGTKEDINFSSFYGRTTRLSFPNDALYLWDRWMGYDRTVIPESIPNSKQDAMRRFFGAMESFSQQASLNKNNALNTYAHLVAEVLPNAFFICLDRDPLYLIQSHYSARKFIHGNEKVSYGIRGNVPAAEDPIEDICRQVLFHREKIRIEQQLIGEDRFLILPYEDFCQRPAYWVGLIAEKFLQVEMDIAALEKVLPPFKTTNKRKIDEAVFEKIEQALSRLTMH